MNNLRELRYAGRFANTVDGFGQNVTDLLAVPDGPGWKLYVSTGSQGSLFSFSFANSTALPTLIGTRAVFGGTRLAEPYQMVLGPDSDRVWTAGSSVTSVIETEIDANGALLVRSPLSGTLGRKIVGLETVEDWGQDYVIARHSGTTELSVFRWDGVGLIEISTLELSKQIDGFDISALGSVRIGASTYVIAASASGDAIASYRLSNAGVLLKVDQIGVPDGLGVNAPSHVELVTAWGESYAIVSATNTSSLSVLRLGSDGTFSLRDHVMDALGTRFQSLTEFAVLSHAGRIFVAAAGTDGGVSLFTLIPDGRLILVSQWSDEYSPVSFDVTSIEMVGSGGSIQIFLAGNGRNIEQYAFDMGALNSPLLADAEGGPLNGSSAEDLLIGGADPDQINGGSGRDILIDGGGSDVLTGAVGADIFVLSSDGVADVIADYQVGTDQIDLSAWGRVYSLSALNPQTLSNGIRFAFGEEVLTVYSSSGSPLRVSHFDREDLFPVDRSLPAAHSEEVVEVERTIINGSTGADILYGTAEAEHYRAQAGDDRLIFSGGDDIYDGGPGKDRMIYGGAQGPLSVDLSDASANSGIAEGKVHIRIEDLDGGHWDDMLTGTSGANHIRGWDGDDVLMGKGGEDRLSGANGNDVLIGGTAADILWGGDGNDILNGGTGADILSGGAGLDTADYQKAVNAIRLDLQQAHLNTGEAKGDKFFSIETIVATDFNDNLSGGALADDFRGSAGNDWLYGRSGNDRLDGGSGNDHYFGGTGADEFVFALGVDTIHDFNQSEGDILVIAASRLAGDGLVDFGSLINGNAVFDFGGGNVLTVADQTEIDLDFYTF